MRLPNEFEWEKACRGNHGQLYPVEIDGTFDENVYSFMAAVDESIQHGGELLNRPVGREPARKTPYGLLDVWEIVSEWCENWFYEELAERLTLYNGDVDKFFAETEMDVDVPYKVMRGGGCYDRGIPRCTMRIFNKPSFKNCVLGFRPVLCSE